MKYVNAFFGWVWRKKAFFAVALASALFFFIWSFPFSDLSQLVTTMVARGTNNQVYFQSRTLDLHFLPTLAVSAEDVSIETGMPPLEASWAKFSPSLFSILFNIRTFMRAGSDPAAANQLLSSLSFGFDAEDLLGAEVDLSMGPGKKSEGGKERSRVALAVESLDLAKVQDWADLPVKMSGKADLETEVQFSPDFQEQPDGDYELKISKFNLPASTVNTEMGPMNLPTLTLANVLLKGRMTNGNLMIEEGTFGASSDPIHGRIKGQLGLRFLSTGMSVVPQVGAYNLTADLNVNAATQKEIGIAFLLFDSAKTPTPTGFRYLFRAQGAGLGGIPQITRLSAF